MNQQYHSSRAIVQRMQIYERLPAPIQNMLQYTLWLALVINSADIILYFFVHPHTTPYGMFYGNAGWFGLVAGAINIIATVYYHIAPIFLWINIAAVVITIIVLVMSHGFNRPVAEVFHWLIGITALPSSVTIVGGALSLGIITLALAVTIALTILAIGLALAILFGGR